MAHIVEDQIVITLSRLAKSEELNSLINDELLATIETVVQELVGDAVVVELKPTI